MLLAVGVNVLAAVEHVRLLRRHERGDPDPFPRWSLGVVTNSVLSVPGVGMVAHLLAR